MDPERNRRLLKVFLVTVTLLCGAQTGLPGLVDYALSDIRVLYLFDRADRIDWPVIYYLNDKYGARVDLVSIHHKAGFRYERHALEEKELYWHQFSVDEAIPNVVDSVLGLVMSQRQPDLVILGESVHSERGKTLYERMDSLLVNLEPDSSSLFQVLRTYRRLEDGQVDGQERVILSREELWRKYEPRILLEIPQLSKLLVPEPFIEERLAQYVNLRSMPDPSRLTPDFLSGIESLRLVGIVGSSGAKGNLIALQAREFISLFNLSERLIGRERAEKMIEGHKKLLEVEYAVTHSERSSETPELASYLGRLLSRTQRAVMGEIGLDWEGKIIVRDSPHGPKLKFRATVAANGSSSIELSYIRFHPYWENAPVVLDSVSRIVAPHQMYVREYGIDVDRLYLESAMPESLLFSSEIVYGGIPLTVSSALPIWEKPDLGVSFAPGFTFVPPVDRLDIDRVSESMNWKVVITKPMYYHGTVKIDLETPRGVFAGAYRQNVQLNKGRTTETVRIPFSVSNLFEPGIQRQVVSLLVDNRLITSDTAIMRTAETTIADTVSIGFLPDTLGRLEDILRMTDATHRPLTDRSLQTGDLDSYNVIIIGSGAVRSYPSFRSVRGRLEEFARNGGSLIVFGQPESWPLETLPISLVPSTEKLSVHELLNRIPEARILSRPYEISERILFSSLDSPQSFPAATISPAEKVYVTSSGATLLSVSRIGSGQVIYCGLPLPEMISGLNIEAIHLFSNLLNY